MEATHLMDLVLVEGRVRVEGLVRRRRDWDLREGRWVWFPRRREVVDADIVVERVTAKRYLKKKSEV